MFSFNLTTKRNKSNISENNNAYFENHQILCNYFVVLLLFFFAEIQKKTKKISKNRRDNRKSNYKKFLEKRTDDGKNIKTIFFELKLHNNFVLNKNTPRSKKKIFLKRNKTKKQLNISFRFVLQNEGENPSGNFWTILKAKWTFNIMSSVKKDKICKFEQKWNMQNIAKSPKYPKHKKG